MKARDLSARKLQARRRVLEGLAPEGRASVIYVGSIGRKEALQGSDDDFMLLVDDRAGISGGSTDTVTIDDVESKLATLDDYERPSSRGVFGKPVVLKDLVENVGLAADGNANTTRRMLFLLEADWATGEEFSSDAHQTVLSRYLDSSVKDLRPPRFLLNDIVRYWRTMCVDFAGKEMEGPEKWGIRNAKLRTSRKILFAGGLLPTLGCVNFETSGMAEYLQSQFTSPPTDRIASAFLREDAIDPGARTLTAYDSFLDILDDKEKRAKLEKLTREDKESCPVFAEAKTLGMAIQSGLLALLFESGDLAATSREYLIF